MDSVSCYFSEHELAHINKTKYDITDWYDIPEEPVVIDAITKIKKDGTVTTWDKFQLYKIVDTVLDKNASKHYITFLTTDDVVTVKMYEDSFNHQNKQVSKKKRKMTLVIKKLFSKNLDLHGVIGCSSQAFISKRYYDSTYQHTICLITEVYDNGDFLLKYERES